MASQRIFQFAHSDSNEVVNSAGYQPKKSFGHTFESSRLPIHYTSSDISAKGVGYNQGISKFSIQNFTAQAQTKAFTVDTDIPSDMGALSHNLGMEASPIKRMPPPKTLLSLQSSISSPLKTPMMQSQRLLRVRRPSFFQLPPKDNLGCSSINSMSFTVIAEAQKRIGQTLESVENSSQQRHSVEEFSLSDGKGNGGAHRRLSLRKALTSKDNSKESKQNMTSRDQSLQPELIFKDLLNMDLNGRLMIDLEQFRRSSANQVAKTGPLDISVVSSHSRAVSVRSILVKKGHKSARELNLNNTESPKKKVAFAKNKMVMLFEKDKKEKRSH